MYVLTIDQPNVELPPYLLVGQERFQSGIAI